jgi:glycosyltransferase involved in cell wall biosynthesis
MVPLGYFKEDDRMSAPLLSVIVPVYNEANTIREILEKINSVVIDKEIIVVDDGSIDGTSRILQSIKYNNLKVIHHSSNRGKGAAFLTGLANASGNFIIIQDADLEYDPNDFLKLIDVIQKGLSDIVFGVRFKEKGRGLVMHRLGNKIITGLINVLFNTKLSDSFTCYKLLRRDTVNMLDIQAKGFEVEAEIITKAIKKRLRISEIPISYRPRSYSEGKKIRLKDGIRSILSIIKYRFIL